MTWLIPDIIDITTVTMAIAFDLRSFRLKNKFEVEVVRVVRANYTSVMVPSILWIYTASIY